jgi:hypothetical protein
MSQIVYGMVSFFLPTEDYETLSDKYSMFEYDLGITCNILSVSELTSLLMNIFLNNIVNVIGSIIY